MDKIIQTYEDAKKFDKDLLRVLNKINNKTSENSEADCSLEAQEKQSERPEDLIETLDRLK